MAISELCTSLQWFIPGEPVFEHLYPRIGRMLPFAGGILFLDGSHLALADRNGGVTWQCRPDGGVWGHPARLDETHVVCADLLESLQIIDKDGNIAASVALPGPPNTELVTDGCGAVFLGIGSLRCDVIRVDCDGRVRWQRPVARDDGLTHALALDPYNGIWVATESGLLLLDPETGDMPVRFKVSPAWRCRSAALPWKNGALVLAESDSGHTLLFHVGGAGDVLAETPLPAMNMGYLFPACDGGAWLVGTTASAADALKASDRVLVFAIDGQGRAACPAVLPGDRALDGLPGPDGGLWISAYTGDEQERGALYFIDRRGALQFQWSPQEPAGVGAPVCLGTAEILVPTSGGIACLRLMPRVASSHSEAP